jgi:5-methylcytosine-specific restriction endonuclease McrA
LALFHTGPGRRTPVLKVRSGCAVVPKDLCNVPTGFLGAESEDEISDKDGQRVYLRQKSPVPNKRRYKIMRRDGFRCRICGVSSDDGAKLEVDHIIARARGGSNDDKNLWTLCFDCNNGKSDSPLSHTA